MTKVLDFLLVLIAVAVVGFVFFLGGLWFYGIAVGLEHVASIPIWLGVVLTLIVLVLFPGAAWIVLSLFGAWAGIVVLDWPWYGSIALYLPVLAIAVIGIVFGVSVGVLVAMAESFGPAWHRFKMKFKRRR